MKEVKMSGNYKDVFDFILSNDLLNHPELASISNFIYGTGTTNELSFNDYEKGSKKMNERRIKEFGRLMELMDTFSDFYKSYHFKYRLNITESKYGSKYY